MTTEPAARDDGLAEYGGVEVGYACPGPGRETQTAGGVLVLAVRAGEPGAGSASFRGQRLRRPAPGTRIRPWPARSVPAPAASSSRSRCTPGVAWLAARSLREQSTSHREAS